MGAGGREGATGGINMGIGEIKIQRGLQGRHVCLVLDQGRYRILNLVASRSYLLVHASGKVGFRGSLKHSYTG